MGALIMAIGMIIVKVAGAAFKVPLSYILGGVGTGYFSTAYTIYTPVYALANHLYLADRRFGVSV